MFCAPLMYRGTLHPLSQNHWPWIFYHILKPRLFIPVFASLQISSSYWHIAHLFGMPLPPAVDHCLKLQN